MTREASLLEQNKGLFQAFVQNADIAPVLHQPFKILHATHMCQHNLLKICYGLGITLLVM